MSSILVNYIVQRKLKKRQKKQLLHNLRLELNTLADVSATLDSNTVYIRPYSLPIWTGAIRSGHIQCLGDIDYFTSLLDIFSYIEEANIIEMKCFELAKGPLSHLYDSLSPTLMKSRQEVSSRVAKGLQLINKQKI